MTQPILIILLKSLNKQDLASLKKHVSDRLTKDSTLLISFHYATENLAKIEKVEDIVSGLYPTIPSKVISNHFSNLYKIAEEWIAHQQLSCEKKTSDALVLKWLHNKGINQLAYQSAKVMTKDILDDTSLDIDKSKNAKYLLNYYLMHKDNKINDQPKEQIQKLIDKYHEAVKSQYLLYTVELQSLTDIHQGDYTEIINNIKSFVESLPNSQLSDIITQLSNLVQNNSIDSLRLLQKTLESGIIDIDSELHFIMASYCYQWVMRLWTKGLHSDLVLVDRIFSYCIKHKIFHKNGKMSPASFHNLVNQVSFFTKDYEKVSQFINQWIDTVDTSKKESTLALAKAQNCFYCEKYNEMFQLTYRSDFDTFNQKNLAQGLHLIATFMNRVINGDLYANTLYLYKLFLKRNKSKMSVHLFQSYSNLCKFMQLVDQKKEISIDLNNFGPIIYRSWCEKQLMP